MLKSFLMSFRKLLFQSSFLVCISAAVAAAADGVAQSGAHLRAVLHHELTVELVPASHQLIAKDRVELEANPQSTSVTFTLAPTLQVGSIRLVRSSESVENTASEQPLTFTAVQSADLSTQQIVVTLPQGHHSRLTLVWTYRGPINDPPREPRHLRFVTPSETSGHIGPEGVYLSSESQWYPDIPGSFSTYRVTTQMPQGWTIVAPGRKEADTASGGMVQTRWAVYERSEAFTLVANTFVVNSREWNGSDGQRVELLTYFFPDNASLADEYLDATAKYLDAYVRILGKYPFEKFAVVENFFASGLGMPSFTLLGSGSIKRHYVQPYALGHEIVHSWIGNSVFNRDDHGNWVEGLTTYLANYYWHEWTQDTRQALEQRRLMLHAYSLYVTPERDYPVSRFLVKHDERDNSIGYQKAAFVFHLLRQEIGDEIFWRGVKTFVARYRNQPADWDAIEAVFAQESGRDLRWFFAQWVEQSGAPILSLGNAEARAVKGDNAGTAWILTVPVQQGVARFRMKVPLRIVMKDATETRWVSLSSSKGTIAEFTVPSQPLRVELDPDLMVFRRLARPQLPPMLNGYVTDLQRTVVKAFTDPASPLQQVVARVTDQELPASQRAAMRPIEELRPSDEGSVLVLGGVERREAIQSLLQESCADRVQLNQSGITIDGHAYEGPKVAVLFSCPRAHVPGSVLTVLYGVTPEAVAKVSRLLFYYGWHSYVLFQDGVVAKRELWQGSLDVEEVRIDGR